MAGRLWKKAKKSRDLKDVGEQDMGMQHQRMCCSKGRMMSSGLSSTSRKKRSFREMILEEILEETLERKKRAKFQQRKFTNKELATLALLKSTSDESDDDNSLSHAHPSTSGRSQVVHSSHRDVSPASVVSNDSFGSAISVTRISPPPDHSAEEAAAKSDQVLNVLTRLEHKMDILESKLNNITDLLTNKRTQTEADVCMPDTQASYLKVEELMEVPGNNPGKYALALMDELFTQEELARSNYISSGQCKRPGLDTHRRKILEECIDKRFGEGTVEAYQHTIKKKCDQKCYNIFRKSK